MTDSEQALRTFTDEFGNVWRWVDGRATFVRGPRREQVFCPEHGGPADDCEECAHDQWVADDQATDEDWYEGRADPSRWADWQRGDHSERGR